LDYQALVRQFGMQASMSRRGNCFDNAPIESFWGTLKNELIYHRRFATRDQVQIKPGEKSPSTSICSTIVNAGRSVSAIYHLSHSHSSSISDTGVLLNRLVYTVSDRPQISESGADVGERLGALLAFYDFPAEHWVHIRTSNPI
jgi:putative transposase